MAYFSNSSEGEVLDSQCAGCLLGSPEAMEMLVDKQGICQVKAEIDSVESFD